jgi:uncharacterized small protein (DUF1192 family)
MVRNKNFYREFEDEIDFINDGGANADEAISNPAVANLVSSIERSKANLMAKKTKLQQQLDALDKEIAKMDAQMATKRSAP